LFDGKKQNRPDRNKHTKIKTNKQTNKQKPKISEKAIVSFG